MPDCQIVRLQDCQIGRLPDCQIARLSDYQIARLQDCQIATVEQPRDLSGHDYFQKAVFDHPWSICLDPNMRAGSNFVGATPQNFES